jgi:hypothetical protein
VTEVQGDGELPGERLKPGMTDRVDARQHRMQPPLGHEAPYRTSLQPGEAQLLAVNESALGRRGVGDGGLPAAHDPRFMEDLDGLKRLSTGCPPGGANVEDLPRRG